MAAKGNIVVVDRTPTTPATHTFVPDAPLRDTPGILFTESVDGIVSGNRTIAVKTKVVRKDKQMVVELVMKIPVVVTETINDVDRSRVERTNWATVTFSFAPLSTQQERKDIVGMTEKCLASAQTMLNSVFVDTEGLV